MQFITLDKLAESNFNMHSIAVRTPVYKESYTYHTNMEYRNTTGLLYLNNCDMTTTSLNTNTQYMFKKNSLVLLPEFLKYYSTFSIFNKSIPSFYIINMNLSSHSFKRLIVESEPFLIFENTPPSIAEQMTIVSEHINSPTLLKSHLFMLWHMIFENMVTKTKIHKTIDHINFANKSNKELAAELNISVSTLTRMFKKHYNNTPGSYALQLKIENAKFQLINTNMAVSQIANNLGFNSPEHFSRIFKKYTNLSPIKYRSANAQKN